MQWRAYIWECDKPQALLVSWNCGQSATHCIGCIAGIYKAVLNCKRLPSDSASIVLHADQACSGHICIWSLHYFQRVSDSQFSVNKRSAYYALDACRKTQRHPAMLFSGQMVKILSHTFRKGIQIAFSCMSYHRSRCAVMFVWSSKKYVDWKDTCTGSRMRCLQRAFVTWAYAFRGPICPHATD